ncbi:hypothetical protein [Streptosporangium longisporum]|uniref:Uncharacterized protein n=1 Tax=Streptosporangium longisporum TaxID=46187 RepID=A0ABP6L4B7_9ACTN
MKSPSEAAADCMEAGGTTTDVLHAIAWAVTAQAGWEDARYARVLDNVLDTAAFLFDCIAHEEAHRTGVTAYADDASFDDMLAEHRPDFLRLVIALSSDEPAATEQGEQGPARARLNEAFDEAMEHGTSVVSAMCVAVDDLDPAGQVPWVIVIDGDRGDDEHYFPSREDALKSLTIDVQESWNRVTDLGRPDLPAAPPDDATEAIEMFFRALGETYELRRADADLTPAEEVER